MTPTRTLFLLVALAFALPATAQTLTATTSDGRAVVLDPDGTWQFADVKPDSVRADATDRPENATRLYEGTRIPYGLWVDPAKWVPSDDTSNEASEFDFEHVDGDVYALVISERIYFPHEAMRNVAVMNAESALTNLQVSDMEPLTVNGRPVFRMRMDGSYQDIVPMTYYGQYYTDEDHGSIQVVTFTSTNLLDDYEDDIEELMNGFVILEDDNRD